MSQSWKAAGGQFRGCLSTGRKTTPSPAVRSGVSMPTRCSLREQSDSSKINRLGLQPQHGGGSAQCCVPGPAEMSTKGFQSSQQHSHHGTLCGPLSCPLTSVRFGLDFVLSLGPIQVQQGQFRLALLHSALLCPPQC